MQPSAAGKSRGGSGTQWRQITSTTNMPVPLILLIHRLPLLMPLALLQRPSTTNDCQDTSACGFATFVTSAAAVAANLSMQRRPRVAIFAQWAAAAAATTVTRSDSSHSGRRKEHLVMHGAVLPPRHVKCAHFVLVPWPVVSLPEVQQGDNMVAT